MDPLPTSMLDKVTLQVLLSHSGQQSLRSLTMTQFMMFSGLLLVRLVTSVSLPPLTEGYCGGT